LAALHLSGMTGSGRTFLALCAGVLVYAASAYTRRDRQFWHDVLCGTRTVPAPHPAKAVISQTA
jgi:hypothetical protein